MIARRAALGLGLVFSGIAQASAAALPVWAVGTWVGVAAIVDDSVAQMGAVGTPAIMKLVERTRLEIGPHSFRASPDGEIALIEGRRVEARMVMLSAQEASPRPGHPMLAGEALGFSMTEKRQAAVLSIRGCREPVMLGSADRPPLAAACHQTYTIIRFPDDAHLAVVASGDNEIVIFKRQP